MKTQVLRLDPHDDILSTRDKMNWGQTGRILLVWPDHGRLLRRRVDLVLLQRHSLSLGAQLALVTTDSQVRFYARSLAIPVFKSLRHAQSAHWRVERRLRQQQNKVPWRPRRDPEALQDIRQSVRPSIPDWLARPITRIGIFTLGAVAVLTLAAALLPGAEVVLTPAAIPQEIQIPVSASPEQEMVNFAGIIPARTISVIVEGRTSVEASGRIQVPDQPSSGRIVFTNLSDQPVRIPRGLVVRSVDSDPVRFVTLQEVQIAAGPGISRTLSVEALTPGKVGNLPAGSLVAIEGSLGLSLMASNPDPTRGGTDRSVPVPTAKDREEIYNTLEASLRESALEELPSLLGAGDILFTPTLTITQVLKSLYTPEADEPSAQVELSLQIEYSALSAAKSDLDTLSQVLLDANLPAGYTPLDGSLEMVMMTQPVIHADASLHWQMAATRRLAANIQSDRAVTHVLGLPPEQAGKRLQDEYDLASTPQIRLSPSWWPRMPFLPFRIRVITPTQPGI